MENLLMVFNVVSFYLNKNNEAEEYKYLYDSFYEKDFSKHYEDAFYDKCKKSIIKEFKNDNIYSFKSFTEVFQKYPLIKKLFFDKRFKSFLDSKKDIRCMSDFIRMLFTFQFNNYVYLDSDLFLAKGFRDSLVQDIKTNPASNFISYGYNDLGIFYCRRFFKNINIMLNTFNNTYCGDGDAMDKGFNKLPEYKNLYNKYHQHYGLLWAMSEVKHIYIINDFIEDPLSLLAGSMVDKLKENALVLLNNKILHFRFLAWGSKPYILFDEENAVNFNDIIETARIKDLKQENIDFYSFIKLINT